MMPKMGFAVFMLKRADDYQELLFSRKMPYTILNANLQLAQYLMPAAPSRDAMYRPYLSSRDSLVLKAMPHRMETDFF